MLVRHFSLHLKVRLANERSDTCTRHKKYFVTGEGSLSAPRVACVQSSCTSIDTRQRVSIFRPKFSVVIPQLSGVDPL